MNENKWLGSIDPRPMLEFLGGKTSDRKLRLFDCACCRRVWALLTDQRSRNAVAVIERFVDGRGTQREWDAARRAVTAVCEAAQEAVSEADAIYSEDHSTADAYAAAEAASCAATSVGFAIDDVPVPDSTALSAASAVGCAAESAAYAAGAKHEAAQAAEEKARAAGTFAQAKLVHDIFGNPFRPVAFDPRWRTANAVAVARTIYSERRFADQPILADALEEAGCINADILDHCRQPGEHVLGCWVVDLILDKH